MQSLAEEKEKVASQVEVRMCMKALSIGGSRGEGRLLGAAAPP